MCQRNGSDRPVTAALIAAVLLAIPDVASAQSIDAVQGGPSFLENFSPFNRSRWRISHGWANGPPQDCGWSTFNVKPLQNGLELLITDQGAAQRAFSCAEVQSTNVYGYGTYEVRMRSAGVPGVLSAFFLYSPGGGGKPHEQISLEFVGKNPGHLLANYNAGAGNRAESIPLGFDSSRSLNDYAFQWTPEGIRWFVNGQVVREVNAAPGEALPSRTAKMHVTSWRGTEGDQQNWLGFFEYTSHPISAVVERVTFTRLGAPCQFPTSVVCTKNVDRRQVKGH